MPSDGKSSHGLWPGELTNATNLCLVDIRLGVNYIQIESITL